MVWTKTFGLKFKTFSSQVTRIWGMRMEVWLWCRCECWVWWMAQVSANVMEIQQWEYEQLTGNVLFWSSPDLYCEVIAGQQLDTSCRESGALCPVSSLLQVPPSHWQHFPRSNKLKDATKETLTIQSDGTTNMKLDRRMPLGCLPQEAASLVTFRSESIMIPE